MRQLRRHILKVQLTETILFEHRSSLKLEHLPESRSLSFTTLICFSYQPPQGFLYTPDMPQRLLRTLKPFHHFVTLHQSVLQALPVMNSLQPLTNPRFPAEFKRPAKQQTRKAYAEFSESKIVLRARP